MIPLIKVTDLAYGRLRSPDLDVAEEFLTQFGMERAERTPSALYMRGTDPAHHIHVTEKGEPGFVGLAYYAPSLDDLKRLAKTPGASAVEAIDEPGGGKRVRLREPNGYQIEVVHGIKPHKAILVKRQPLNLGNDGLKRAGAPMRLPKGPSRVKRIGHGVMAAPNVIPMADIMLVLLIIFMVVTPMLQKGVSVDMAKVNNAEDMQNADKDDAIILAVTRDGKMYLGSKQVVLSEITTNAQPR